MEKIIQIIPAPSTMAAHYESVDHNGEKLRHEDGRLKSYRIPIACLALYEYDDGENEIRAMIMTSEGYTELATANTDFICVTVD